MLAGKLFTAAVFCSSIAAFGQDGSNVVIGSKTGSSGAALCLRSGQGPGSFARGKVATGATAHQACIYPLPGESGVRLLLQQLSVCRRTLLSAL